MQVQINYKEEYYQGHYIIAFYKKEGNDERYIAGFNTIKDICKFKQIKVTSINVKKIQRQLTRALMNEPPLTKILGPELYVYKIDMIEEDDFIEDSIAIFDNDDFFEIE